MNLLTWRVCILCYYSLREHSVQDDTMEDHLESGSMIFSIHEDCETGQGLNSVLMRGNAPINFYFHPCFDVQFPAGAEVS